MEYKQADNLVQAERTDPDIYLPVVMLVVKSPLMQPGEYLVVALAPEKSICHSK